MMWVLLGFLAVIVVFVLILAVWAISVYNGLVRSRQNVKGEWANIDTLLQRRHDLIPNLVETVKGYASHERETLEAVMNARNAAMNSRTPEQQIAAEQSLTGAVGRLFAVAEAYPNLKADANFRQLQGELTETENGIARQRQSYNNAVESYNTRILSFPANMVAGPFGFTSEPFFELTEPAAREAPKVSF